MSHSIFIRPPSGVASFGHGSLKWILDNDLTCLSLKAGAAATPTATSNGETGATVASTEASTAASSSGAEGTDAASQRALPEGWDRREDPNGRVYYVNHKNRLVQFNTYCANTYCNRNDIKNLFLKNETPVRGDFRIFSMKVFLNVFADSHFVLIITARLLLSIPLFFSDPTNLSR